MKTKAASGLVVLHRVESDHKNPPLISLLGLRASDIEKVSPMLSVLEPDAHAIVSTSDQAYWVTESVEEVVAKVNALSGDEFLKRIAIAVEQINQYGIKADVAEAGQ
jgi:uncharacterized protein YlzI (FlbEa/FlbD family)